MHDRQHPLLLPRTTSKENGSRLLEQYEIGNLVHLGGTDRMNRVRLLWSAFEPQKAGQEFLLKTIPNRKQYKSSIDQQVKEVNFLRSLPQNLKSKTLNLHGFWSDEENVYTVFENSSNNSLHGLINYCKLIKRPMKDTHILYFLKKVLEAVHVLHKSSIIHGNIKADNVMIDEKLQIKLRGFGGSEKERDAIKRTPYYLPPETININEFSQESEVWTLGILTYYLFDVSFPFKLSQYKSSSSQKKKELFDIILKDPLDLSDLKAQTKYEQDCIDLLKLMLKKSSSERMSVSEMIKLDIFNEIGLEEDQLKEDIIQWYQLYFKGLHSHQWNYPIQKINNKPANWVNSGKVRAIKAIRLSNLGFFIQLANQTVIGYFNDHTLSCTTMPTNSNSPQEQGRLNILNQITDKYLVNYPICLDHFAEQYQWEPQCSISKLFFKDDALFVRLTNDTFQVFFFEKEHQTDQLEYEFNLCVTLNNSTSNCSEVLLERKGEKMIRFGTFHEGMANTDYCKYFQFISNSFKLMYQHPQISFEAAQYNAVNIQSLPQKKTKLPLHKKESMIQLFKMC